MALGASAAGRLTATMTVKLVKMVKMDDPEWGATDSDADMGSGGSAADGV